MRWYIHHGLGLSRFLHRVRSPFRSADRGEGRPAREGLHPTLQRSGGFRVRLVVGNCVIVRRSLSGWYEDQRVIRYPYVLRIFVCSFMKIFTDREWFSLVIANFDRRKFYGCFAKKPPCENDCSGEDNSASIMIPPIRIDELFTLPFPAWNSCAIVSSD
jgi:hypothetical protein